MLDTFEIICFQSHKHTVVKLHPGINVFKGTSHHGKSSIIRALRWLFFNRSPGRGESFKSWFANPKDPVEVAASFLEGEWIARVRDDENKYLSDGIELKALRTDVPDEIKKISQISMINFQSQNDPYFLIEDSPGIAGKKLNEIIGLEIIDHTRTTINNRINKLTTQLSLTNEDLKTTKEKLEKYGHVKKAERLVNRIEVLESQKINKIDRKERIFNIIKHIELNHKRISDLKNWLKIETDYKELKNQFLILGNKKDRLHKISDIIIEIKHNQNILDKSKKLVSMETNLKEIKVDLKKLNKLKNTRFKISNILSDIQKAQKLKNESSHIIKVSEEHKSELEKQLNYCPTCGAERKYWRK